MNGIRFLYIYQLFVVFLTFRIHREPTFSNAFSLLEDLVYSPKTGEGEDS